ncbi:MAG: preprotein translocase subunit SecG [Gammaproteobacteria bacterium]|jgi:preprotein translocase subunit SecG
MEQVILIFHVVFAVALIGLVLLQKGKGASMGAAFGSGASQTVFGSRGSIGFLMKLTLLFAALFFATSIWLTYLAAHRAKESPSQGLLSQVKQISQSTNKKPAVKVKSKVVIKKNARKKGKR